MSPIDAVSPRGSLSVTLSEIDRNLLERCLARKPRSWEDFVDRFLGLVIHVINHAAQCRSIRLRDVDRDDLGSEVMLAIVKDDFAVLRHFRGESSLATYLTVIARRVIVRKLLDRKSATSLRIEVPESADVHSSYAEAVSHQNSAEERVSNQEEVEHLLEGLNHSEQRVVRLYHLEGKSYQEISAQVGMPENSVGPTLTRARTKMRRSSR